MIVGRLSRRTGRGPAEEGAIAFGQWWSRGLRPVEGGASWRGSLARIAIGVVSIATFVLALELMKAGAQDAATLLDTLTATGDPVTALGLGWLLAFVVLSRSPVAAATMALVDSGVLTPLQAYAMVSGSRLGASMVVVLLGFLWIVRGRGSRQGLAIGLLAMVVTITVQVPALALGIVVLRLGLVPSAWFSLPVVDVVDRVYAPLVDVAGDMLPGVGLFVLGTVVIVVSFNLFDRALPEVSLPGDDLSGQAVFRPIVMFVAGLVVTALTMSVSVSIGLLVPLSARGLVRRENVVPYVMGCNVSTFIDTLLVVAAVSLLLSPVPTLVVGDAPVAVHHVLVCTSLQMPHGTAALRPAVAIAAATHAEVEVLHVMSQLPHTGGRANTSSEASERRRDEHDAARDHNLDETTTVFVERGLEARGRIRHGLVVDEIIAEARRLPADLVVLGAHGRPGPVSNLLTNITEHVVDELARPVLVVREPSASDT